MELSQGITRIQVDKVPPEQWDMPYTPQFIIEFHNGMEFITLTLQLEDGRWYDRSARLPDEDVYLRYFELGSCVWNPDYRSPLLESAIIKIGQAISRHMVVHLTAYMGLLVPVFREPTLN
ncbi:hypothetical protein [Mucilaginibacter sp.]|uniref:hypothetical protein n=1 Tax=Mucilaginibacter sp. TaxID=1882438 RepID=UPI002608BD25|nr:hypothetical protein [Mucilaginibacter sp.]